MLAAPTRDIDQYGLAFITRPRRSFISIENRSLRQKLHLNILNVSQSLITSSTHTNNKVQDVSARKQRPRLKHSSFTDGRILLFVLQTTTRIANKVYSEVLIRHAVLEIAASGDPVTNMDEWEMSDQVWRS